MDTRVAVMAIIIEEPDAVEKLNTTLHSVSEYIICLLYTSDAADE